MTDSTAQGLSTRSVHAGEQRDHEGAIHTPLYNHSTFAFDSTADLLDVVEGRPSGNLYTCYGRNPTIRSLEARLADLEGAEQALAFSSGMAAEAATFLAHCRTGDHIVCTRRGLRRHLRAPRRQPAAGRHHHHVPTRRRGRPAGPARPSPGPGSEPPTTASRSPAAAAEAARERHWPASPCWTAYRPKRPSPTSAATTTGTRWRRRGSGGTYGASASARPERSGRR